MDPDFLEALHAAESVDILEGLVKQRKEEINYLEEKISALKAQQDAAQRDKLSALIPHGVFPYSRAPSEIMSEIFSHCIDCIPPDDISSQRYYKSQPCSRQGQLKLMHVAQRWRQIVTSTPSFWTCVFIDVRALSSSPPHNQFIVTMTKMWLRHSGRLPLDIVVCDAQNNPSPSQIPCLFSSLAILAEEIGRWRSFQLLLPPGWNGIPRVWPRSIDWNFLGEAAASLTNSLPLERMCVHLAPEYTQNLLEVLAAVASSSSAMRELKWSNSIAPLLRHNISFQLLTSLSLVDSFDEPFAESDIVQLLRCCSALEQFSLHMRFNSRISSGGNGRVLLVTLNCLTLMSIKHVGEIPSFLKLLTLPKLTHLTIRRDVEDGEHRVRTSYEIWIFHLLERSHCPVQKLDLDIIPYSDHIAKIVGLSSVRQSLKHLTLYCDLGENVEPQMLAALSGGTLPPSLTYLELEFELAANGGALKSLLSSWTRSVKHSEIMLKQLVVKFRILTAGERIKHVDIEYRPDDELESAFEALEEAGVNVDYSDYDVF